MVPSREQFNDDCARNFGEVYLSEVLQKKFPGAGRDCRWQWVFPSGRLSVDSRSDETGVDTIFTRTDYSAPSNSRRIRPASTRRSAPTLYVTRSRPAYWKQARTPYRARSAGALGRVDDTEPRACVELRRSSRQQPARHVDFKVGIAVELHSGWLKLQMVHR